MPDASETVTGLPELPSRLSSVFRALRNGRHISRSDGPDFLDLERHTPVYQHLLRGLGYNLQRHNQSFFYLEGAGTIRAERMRGALLFLLILFQDLEEKKFQRQDRAWERSLLRNTFKLSEMPHFQTAQRRALMAAVGIEEATLLKELQFLERLGVVQLLPEGQFGFRAPVYRFIELCMRYADDQSWSASAPTESTDGDVARPDPEDAEEESEP